MSNSDHARQSRDELRRQLSVVANEAADLRVQCGVATDAIADLRARLAAAERERDEWKDKTIQKRRDAASADAELMLRIQAAERERDEARAEAAKATFALVEALNQLDEARFALVLLADEVGIKGGGVPSTYNLGTAVLYGIRRKVRAAEYEAYEEGRQEGAMTDEIKPTREDDITLTYVWHRDEDVPESIDLPALLARVRAAREQGRREGIEEAAAAVDDGPFESFAAHTIRALAGKGEHGRCPSREGDGRSGCQCELKAGHKGNHACPEALKRHLESSKP